MLYLIKNLNHQCTFHTYTCIVMPNGYTVIIIENAYKLISQRSTHPESSKDMMAWHINILAKLLITNNNGLG